MRNFSTVIQFLSSSKAVTTALFLLIVTGGIFTTVILTFQSQDVRQRAGTETTPLSCQDCQNLSLSTPFFCRNPEGVTDCQPKDISSVSPGTTCIACASQTIQEEENKNPISAWWDSIVEAMKLDKNQDGKVNLQDAQMLIPASKK